MATQVPEPSASSVSLVALLPHATRTASGSGSAVTLAGEFRWLVTELVVTAASGSAFSLDVWVQQSVDGGHNWDDVLAFITWSSGGDQHYHQVGSLPVRERDAAGEVHAAKDGSLSSGSTAAAVLGRTLRVRWSISGVDPSFSFQVLAYLRS